MKRQIDIKVCPTKKPPNPRSESSGSVTVPVASRPNAETDPELGLSQHSAHIPIRASLVGSNHSEALGITGRGRTPILALCRALVAAGHDPHRPLHVYRGDVLALRLGSIGKGAKLTVKEDRTGPRFVAWEPFPRRVGAWMRKKGEGLGGAPDQFDEPGATPGAAVRTSAKSLRYSDSGPGRRPR